MNYPFGTAHYKIGVENPNNINRIIQRILPDGKLLSGSLCPLTEDGSPHKAGVVRG